jgi:type I restriction enzyme S subunit
LLRWTTALDAKWKKLAEYREKGIVGPSDGYVVAINGCQLSRFPDSRGITQMPFGVEAVFPVGPLVYRVDGATGRIRDGSISERFHIINANNTAIPTTPFVDPNYSGVSALIGCVAVRTCGKPLDLHVVHNPRADVPLPLGSLGGRDDEWIAAPVPNEPDEFELKRVVRS